MSLRVERKAANEVYIPKAFRMDHASDITSFLRDNSFGVIVQAQENDFLATHVPFLYDADRAQLCAHVAKANPQAEQLDGQRVMVVFQGPHAYISPSWYGIPKQVPTWNYVAVHVHGVCHVVHHSEALVDILEQTIYAYEPNSSLPKEANQPFYQNMTKAIVGFRVEITRIEGVAKLSQNKPVEVQRRVIRHLRNSTDNLGDKTAVMMQQKLEQTNPLSDLTIRPLAENESLPMDLLLLADPSRASILHYTEDGSYFIVDLDGSIVGVYVLLRRDATTVELMNIAVHEDVRRNGIGKQLVLHAIETARRLGYTILGVGTGNSSFHQLALYQKCGFRIASVDRDFFVRNYRDRIYENGLMCRDMVRLTIRLEDDEL